MPEYCCIKCFSCGTFQAHQVTKAGAFSCKLCGDKQKVLKHYAISSSAKDIRLAVQQLNAARGSAEEDVGSGDLPAASQRWEAGCGQQQLQPTPRTQAQAAASRWTTFMSGEEEDDAGADGIDASKSSVQVYHSISDAQYVTEAPPVPPKGLLTSSGRGRGKHGGAAPRHNSADQGSKLSKRHEPYKREFAQGMAHGAAGASAHVRHQQPYGRTEGDQQRQHTSSTVQRGGASNAMAHPLHMRDAELPSITSSRPSAQPLFTRHSHAVGVAGTMANTASPHVGGAAPQHPPPAPQCQPAPSESTVMCTSMPFCHQSAPAWHDRPGDSSTTICHPASHVHGIKHPNGTLPLPFKAQQAVQQRFSASALKLPNSDAGQMPTSRDTNGQSAALSHTGISSTGAAGGPAWPQRWQQPPCRAGGGSPQEAGLREQGPQQQPDAQLRWGAYAAARPQQEQGAREQQQQPTTHPIWGACVGGAHLPQKQAPQQQQQQQQQPAAQPRWGAFVVEDEMDGGDGGSDSEAGFVTAW